MSNDLVSIDDLRKQYEEKIKTKDLKVFADKQQQVIVQLLKEREDLEKKITHLESLLSNVPLKGIATPLSSEELICMSQLELLKRKSEDRELSLDEVKRFDLLVKNLRLIREQSTQVINAPEYTDVKDTELVAIARGIQE